MFVSLRGTQTWRLHTKLYEFVGHTSANNARMKHTRDLIPCKVVYILIIYRISDSWLLSSNGYAWKPRITNRTIFCSKLYLFLSQWEWDSRTKSCCLANLAIKLCDFKMDLIKWQLNFGSCNLVWNHTSDFKSNSRCPLVQFWNHAYDFRPNCTPFSSISIGNHTVSSSI